MIDLNEDDILPTLHRRAFVACATCAKPTIVFELDVGDRPVPTVRGHEAWLVFNSRKPVLLKPFTKSEGEVELHFCSAECRQHKLIELALLDCEMSESEVYWDYYIGPVKPCYALTDLLAQPLILG